MTVLKKKRVLILEEEPLIALVAEQYLRSLGAEQVVRAPSIERAAETLRSERFDAALFDSQAGGMSSLSLAHQQWAQGIAVVVADDKEPGTDVDTVSAIGKPYSLPHLEKAFESAFARRLGGRCQ
jgi:CheY-like chemotaxis protein